MVTDCWRCYICMPTGLGLKLPDRDGTLPNAEQSLDGQRGLAAALRGCRHSTAEIMEPIPDAGLVLDENRA